MNKRDEIEKLRNKLIWQEKKLQIYDMWIKSLIDGNDIYDFLTEKEYRKVGVYGFGRIGQMLCDYLLKKDGMLCFIMDNNYSLNHTEYNSVSVIKPTSDIVDVDIIINTVPEADKYLKSELFRKRNIKSIGDILFGLC